MLQATALSILKTGANVFLTGEPGSGKTHTINTYIEWLRERGIEPAITASTGIAATHVGGMTIHAWSGIGVKRDLTPYDIDEIVSRERLVKRAEATHVLVIDEISMIDSRTLSMAETAIRALKRSDRPWGGMQVVFVGDFYQLPPVSRKEESEATIQMNTGETTSGVRRGFAFTSAAWASANPLVSYLSEQHRQNDLAFLDLLSAIRKGAVTDAHHELLSSRRSEAGSLPEKVTRLYSHNANVDRENTEQLERIEGKTETYTMSSKGSQHLVENLKRGCLSPETLTLKKGARVMFTKNSMDGAYANGTLGEVVDFDAAGPVVRTNSGRALHVVPAEWSVTDGGKVLARISQIPLRLAWAITVHKSQGMTLDAAAVDLSAAFEYGQGYVALSRVRALTGLHVLGYNEQSLLVHPEIISQDRAFKWSSAAARKRFEAMEPSEHTAFADTFVKASGGNPAGGARQRPKESIDTNAATLALAKQGLSIEKIARARSLKAETIISHLEILKERGDMAASEIESMIPAATIKTLRVIQTALRKQKTYLLTPVFKALKGAHSFENIRLARLLL